MYKIDEFSYKCGVIDCFSEMVKAGVKKIALTHPETRAEDRNQYLEFIDDITKEYGIRYYVEDEPLINDMFAISMCRDTYLVILYRLDEDIESYLELKDRRRKAIDNGTYEIERTAIAYDFGHLLGYRDDDIGRYIAENSEKENQSL